MLIQWRVGSEVWSIFWHKLWFKMAALGMGVYDAFGGWFG